MFLGKWNKKLSLISLLRLTFPLPMVSSYHVVEARGCALLADTPVWGIPKVAVGNVVCVWYRHSLCGKFPFFMSVSCAALVNRPISKRNCESANMFKEGMLFNAISQR